MKTITGTIPLSVLNQIDAADIAKAYVDEPVEQKFVGMSTRDNKAFQAYIALRDATPQEEARSQPQQALKPVGDSAQLKAGDLVMWLGCVTHEWKPRKFVCYLNKVSGQIRLVDNNWLAFNCTPEEWRLPTPAERAEFAPENGGWIECEDKLVPGLLKGQRIDFLRRDGHIVNNFTCTSASGVCGLWGLKAPDPLGIIAYRLVQS